MAAIKVRTKNKIGIDKKPRVYFTCHPNDMNKYFDKICQDILKTLDCAIFYTENMTEIIAEEDKDIELGRNSLFVVPVTLNLLTTPNRAMAVDIPYAKKEHIPVLPFMMESGLDSIYSRPDKFGEMQYLNPNSTDASEISYEEKLKKHLESVLISAETMERVRAAFDAYIFLSYRKKDRRYANELMRLIHENPKCRSIAIWYDEFLVPGESFKDGIYKILSDSKLFALLVTPNLLEEANFVMSEEYPAAKKAGIEILPAEMVETDKNELNSKYQGLPVCSNTRDKDAFQERLFQTLHKIAVSTDKKTYAHNFLIGLAYMDGIDVEVDRAYGVKLISEAGEAGLPEAMYKLFDMYKNGIGVTIDYAKAVVWGEKIVAYCMNRYGEKHSETINRLYNLSEVYRLVGNYKKSIALSEKNYRISCSAYGAENPITIKILNTLAISYSESGELKKAINLKEQVCGLFNKAYGEMHPYTVVCIGNLAEGYRLSGDYKKAIELNEKAYALACNVRGIEHPDTITNLNNLALSYSAAGNLQKSFELKEKVYNLYEKVLGEMHPNTITSLGNVAVSYYNSGNFMKALELMEKVYSSRRKVLGETHPETASALNQINVIRSKMNGNK